MFLRASSAHNDEYAIKLIAKIEDLLKQEDIDSKNVKKSLEQIIDNDYKVIREYYLIELIPDAKERELQLGKLFEGPVVTDSIYCKYLWARYILITNSKENEDKALRTLRQLATKNQFAPAYYLLYLYTIDRQIESKSQLIKAAKLGYPRAIAELGKEYLENTAGNNYPLPPLPESDLQDNMSALYLDGYPTVVKAVNDFLAYVLIYLENGKFQDDKNKQQSAAKLCEIATNVCPYGYAQNAFRKIQKALKEKAVELSEYQKCTGFNMQVARTVNQFSDQPKKLVDEKFNYQTSSEHALIIKLKKLASSLDKKTAHHQIYAKAIREIIEDNNDHDHHATIIRRISALELYRQVETGNYHIDQHHVTKDFLLDKLSEVLVQFKFIHNYSMGERSEDGIVESGYTLDSPHSLVGMASKKMSEHISRKQRFFIGNSSSVITERNYSNTLKAMHEANTSDITLIQQVKALQILRKVEAEANGISLKKDQGIHEKIKDLVIQFNQYKNHLLKKHKV